jgi:hypothetical protein
LRRGVECLHLARRGSRPARERLDDLRVLTRRVIADVGVSGEDVVGGIGKIGVFVVGKVRHAVCRELRCCWFAIEKAQDAIGDRIFRQDDQDQGKHRSADDDLLAVTLVTNMVGELLSEPGKLCCSVCQCLSDLLGNGNSGRG